MATQSVGTYGNKLNLLIKQGSTFGPMQVTLNNPDATPVDITGCLVRAQIRRKALDPELITSFVVVITDPTNGIFNFSLTDETTAGITAGEVSTTADSRYVWDMELEDVTGRVLPIYYGDVNVFREVTRA